MLSQFKAHVYIRDENFNLLPDQSTRRVFKKAPITAKEFLEEACSFSVKSIIIHLLLFDWSKMRYY